MLHLNGRRVFLCQAAVDMRKSYDTLADLIRASLGKDPFTGDVFMFLGRDRIRLKVLVWEGDGFWLCTKRLETARFVAPQEWGRGDGAATLSLTGTQVAALLSETIPRALIRMR
jgi:transposase